VSPITQSPVAAHIAVGHTSPAELATNSGPAGGGHLLLRVTGANPVYIGGPAVVAAPSGEEEGGFEVKPTDGIVRVSVPARGRLYAICAGSETSEVQILRT
jgi:hypothetical protein